MASVCKTMPKNLRSVLLPHRVGNMIARYGAPARPKLNTKPPQHNSMAPFAENKKQISESGKAPTVTWPKTGKDRFCDKAADSAGRTGAKKSS